MFVSKTLAALRPLNRQVRGGCLVVAQGSNQAMKQIMTPQKVVVELTSEQQLFWTHHLRRIDAFCREEVGPKSSPDIAAPIVALVLGNTGGIHVPAIGNIALLRRNLAMDHVGGRAIANLSQSMAQAPPARRIASRPIDQIYQLENCDFRIHGPTPKNAL